MISFLDLEFVSYKEWEKRKEEKGREREKRRAAPLGLPPQVGGKISDVSEHKFYVFCYRLIQRVVFEYVIFLLFS